MFSFSSPLNPPKKKETRQKRLPQSPRAPDGLQREGLSSQHLALRHRLRIAAARRGAGPRCRFPWHRRNIRPGGGEGGGAFVMGAWGVQFGLSVLSSPCELCFNWGLPSKDMGRGNMERNMGMFCFPMWAKGCHRSLPSEQGEPISVGKTPMFLESYGEKRAMICLLDTAAACKMVGTRYHFHLLVHLQKGLNSGVLSFLNKELLGVCPCRERNN